MPIYRADVEYELFDAHVEIIATVETIGPTGVEMEALTAVSLAGLTLYDMLKPHCEPEDLLRWIKCRLQQKKGGKSHFTRVLKESLSASGYCAVRYGCSRQKAGHCRTKRNGNFKRSQF